MIETDNAVNIIIWRPFMGLPLTISLLANIKLSEPQEKENRVGKIHAKESHRLSRLQNSKINTVYRSMSLAYRHKIVIKISTNCLFKMVTNKYSAT